MNPEMPPAGPEPSNLPPPRPHIEVQAEPARAEDRGPVINAPPPINQPPISAPPPPRDPPSGPSASPASPQQRNTSWAMLCHLSGLLNFFLPLLGLVATLTIWLIKKDEDAEANFHGKESLNFQISILIWFMVSGVLVCCVIGIPLLLALPIFQLVMTVVGAVKAAGGERWRYPLTLRLIT